MKCYTLHPNCCCCCCWTTTQLPTSNCSDVKWVQKLNRFFSQIKQLLTGKDDTSKALISANAKAESAVCSSEAAAAVQSFCPLSKHSIKAWWRSNWTRSKTARAPRPICHIGLIGLKALKNNITLVYNIYLSGQPVETTQTHFLNTPVKSRGGWRFILRKRPFVRIIISKSYLIYKGCFHGVVFIATFNCCLLESTCKTTKRSFYPMFFFSTTNKN